MALRAYSVISPAASISAAQDLVRITAPSDASLEILRASVSQRDSETSSQVEVLLKRAASTGAGTAITPEALFSGSSNAQAYGGTAIAVDSTGTASSTSVNPLVGEGFNLLNGWLYMPVPEERILVGPSSHLVVRLNSAPAAAAEITATVVVGVVG